MQKNKKLVKGLYEHEQIGGYLSVRQFMVINQYGKRCLLLRFENETSKMVNAFEFTVKRLDAEGNVIGSTTVCHDRLSIKAGEFYAPESGIVIESDCVDFVVQMRYVISQNIKYIYRKGMVTAHYDPRGFTDDGTTDNRPHTVSVKRKYSASVGFFRWMAFLAFILGAAALSYLLYTYR